MDTNKFKRRRRILRSNESNIPRTIYQNLSRAFNAIVESGRNQGGESLQDSLLCQRPATRLEQDSRIIDPMSDEELHSTPGSTTKITEGRISIPKVKVSPAGLIENEKEINSALIILLKRGMKYAGTYDRLLTFLVITGSRLQREHYSIFKDTVQTMTGNAVSMLSYSTARENQSQYFNGQCFPQSSIFHIAIPSLPDSNPKKKSLVTTASGDEKDVRECIKVVLPSQWAKYDIGTYPAYQDLIMGQHHKEKNHISIENSAVVCNRRAFTGSTKSFWALYKGVIINIGIGTYISIQVDGQNVDEKDLESFSIINQQSEFYWWDGSVGPQWCVSPVNHQSPWTEAIDETEFSPNEKLVYEYLKSSNSSVRDACKNRADDPNPKKPLKKKQRTIPKKFESNSKAIIIYPSDIITILRPLEESNSSNMICIMLSSFVSTVTGSESERLLWICTDSIPSSTRQSIHAPERTGNKSADSLQILVLQSLPVIDIPIVDEDRCDDVAFFKIRDSKPYGTLKDGRKFVIYRFALYADEFGYDGICGIYILLLGAAQHNRISSAGVRALTLVPKLQNVNKVLDILLDDILEGMLYGFEAVDPDGDKIMVFLDMVSFFADYVKMSNVTNSAGHSATSFCTLCKMSKSSKNIGPQYSYSEKMHCRRLGFMKCDEIVKILTSINTPNELRTQLGFKFSEWETAKNLPLVRFSHKLASASVNNLPKKECGDLVIDNYFDSNLSTAIAPDHLLSGLINVLLEACFLSLPTLEDCRVIESKILKSAAENDLPTQGPFLTTKDKKCKGLSSITMSTSYVILLFASKIFKDLEKSPYDTAKIFHIPTILQNIVARLYFWPVPFTERKSLNEKYRDHNGCAYLRSLKLLTDQYTDEVRKHMMEFGDDAILKDRPNSHRLNELIVHTIPLFGHGNLVSELVLEFTHAFFKSWMKLNTHSSSHLTAVDLFVTRVWSSHILFLHYLWKQGEGPVKDMAFRNLLRSFFGEGGILISNHPNILSDEVKYLVDEFSKELDGIMKSPLDRLLKGSMTPAFMKDEVKWVCSKKKTYKTLDNVTQSAVSILSSHEDESVIKTKEQLQFYEKASHTVFGKYNIGSVTYPHKTIYRGVPVRLVVSETSTETTFLSGDPADSNYIKYFLVHDIVVHNSVPYIFSRRLCFRYDRDTELSFLSLKENHDVVVIRLTNQLTRIGFCDITTPSSLKSPQVQQKIREKGDLSNGNEYHVLLKCTGYPPCLG